MTWILQRFLNCTLSGRNTCQIKIKINSYWYFIRFGARNAETVAKDLRKQGHTIFAFALGYKILVSCTLGKLLYFSLVYHLYSSLIKLKFAGISDFLQKMEKVGRVDPWKSDNQCEKCLYLSISHFTDHFLLYRIYVMHAIYSDWVIPHSFTFSFYPNRLDPLTR